jgi:predicted component of type VI protein secretion system
MGNRIRCVEEKVQAVKVALAEVNVERAAREAGVPASTLRYDLAKVIANLGWVLANKRPGPSRSLAEEESPAVEQERSRCCPQCGYERIWENGSYWVLNWLAMLLVGWLSWGRIRIRRWRCAPCGHELSTPERQRQAQARRAWWQQVRRLIALSQFKLGLSVRKTQVLIGFVYAREVSLGLLMSEIQRCGSRAQGLLARLAACSQKAARFLLYDETFPKLRQRGWSLGVAICEHGLIRSVRVITRQGRDIPRQLAEIVGGGFQPQFFLTDLDVTYGYYLKQAALRLRHLRDAVHLLRQLMRLFEEAVRDVTLDVPKGTTVRRRKQQRRLKQRLLRQQLQPLLNRVLKAFQPGYESVCTLLLRGIVEELAHLPLGRSASVQTLARRLRRFLNKHEPTINTLLEQAVTEHTPKTTNALESKNSLFKPFSRIAKYFPRWQSCQAFFAGVALMENFDVKTRGGHTGTSAMQRAEINLEEFGAADFFEAVGLTAPQISLEIITDS